MLSSYRKSKLVSALFVILFAFSTNAQITIYRTYKDYLTQNGEEYDDFLTYTLIRNKTQLHLTNGGLKVKIWCRDMWGFKYKDSLFRTNIENEQPVMLVSNGKITYFENGLSHLIILRDSEESDQLIVDENQIFCFLSKGINSTLTPMPRPFMLKGRKEMKSFREHNPEYSELFECMGGSPSYVQVRSCVAKFEEGQ